jgi:hypothetical protein
MKIVKVIAILLLGPLLGILVAFSPGSLALPYDPNFISSGNMHRPAMDFR